MCVPWAALDSQLSVVVAAKLRTAQKLRAAPAHGDGICRDKCGEDTGQECKAAKSEAGSVCLGSHRIHLCVRKSDLLPHSLHTSTRVPFLPRERGRNQEN